MLDEEARESPQGGPRWRIADSRRRRGEGEASPLPLDHAELVLDEIKHPLG